MAEQKLPKLTTRVRFPSPAPVALPAPEPAGASSLTAGVRSRRFFSDGPVWSSIHTEIHSFQFAVSRYRWDFPGARLQIPSRFGPTTRTGSPGSHTATCARAPAKIALAVSAGKFLGSRPSDRPRCVAERSRLTRRAPAIVSSPAPILGQVHANVGYESRPTCNAHFSSAQPSPIVLFSMAISFVHRRLLAKLEPTSSAASGCIVHRSRG